MIDPLSSTPPNDPLFISQWGAKNTGAVNQGSGTVGADINLLGAWDITMGNPLIKIAVIDEGVDRLHPDLINNISPNGYGLHFSNATSGKILSNARSHGTACAGIIAAEANNNIGVAGVAPLCKLIPVNITVTTDGVFGTFAQIASAIDWSWDDGGADVLSNSWGGGTASSLLKDAIHRAVTLGRNGKGCVVVFSSGNNDSGLSSPAIFPETITVGAMSMCYERKSISTCDGEYWWGSNYGTGLDISAPGVKISTTTVTGTGISPNLNYTLSFNGTSSAAPVVSGVAALVLSVNSNLTQLEVREIMENTARKVGSYSYNFVQNQANGSWCPELGHGVVSANNAVIAAQAPSFCDVEISVSGPTQVCSSGSVVLNIANHSTGNTYKWRKNGSIVGSGISYNASQTGNYDVVLLTASGCRDTSYKVQVTVSPQQGALTANAGRDTIIGLGRPTFLGGGPSGSGGTGIIHPMRGMASDITNNTLIRFDPLQPSTNFQTIKVGFNPNLGNNIVYTGAASTPYGLFMVDNKGNLAKIDTATGTAYPVNSTAIFGMDVTGMTYDPTTGKIFVVANIGSNYRMLHEFNRQTGVYTSIGQITALTSLTYCTSLSADNNGQLFGLNYSQNGEATMVKINKSNGTTTILDYPSFLAYFNQGGDADPLTNELYQTAVTAPLNSTAYAGTSLWKMNKITGSATLIGSVAEPFNQLDALTFANKEYKYQWSPTTNLSNPNDANPRFTSTTEGTFVYTLTVTDLCGNTATDQVSLEVFYTQEECLNTNRYPTSAVAASSNLVTISSCSYFGEYSEISNIVSGQHYKFTVTGNGYITVRTGSPGGSVVAAGFSPLTITAPNSSNLFAHWNAELCGASSICLTTTVQKVWDCPALSANIGDACDDGNPGTDNTVVDGSCNCAPPNAATLTGSVTWTSACGVRNANVILYQPGTATQVSSYNASIQSDGSFSIPELEIGTFDVIVKVVGYLAKGVRNVEIGSGDNNLSVGAIINGNINNDGMVNITDFSLFSPAFSSLSGDANYNPLADFNCNGVVNITDFSIFVPGFNKLGDVAPLSPLPAQ